MLAQLLYWMLETKYKYMYQLGCSIQIISVAGYETYYRYIWDWELQETGERFRVISQPSNSGCWHNALAAAHVSPQRPPQLGGLLCVSKVTDLNCVQWGIVLIAVLRVHPSAPDYVQLAPHALTGKAKPGVRSSIHLPSINVPQLVPCVHILIVCHDSFLMHTNELPIDYCARFHHLTR